MKSFLALVLALVACLCLLTQPAAFAHRAAQPDGHLLPRSDDVRQSTKAHLVRPGSFPFQTITSSDGMIILHYYNQPSSFATSLFNTVQTDLHDYVERTLGLSLKKPFNIYAYNSRADFIAGAEPDNPENTGAFTSFGDESMYLPIYDGSDAPSVISHEMTHVVLHQNLDTGHLENDFRLIPNWLDEGMAEFDVLPGGDYDVYDKQSLRDALNSGGFADLFTEFLWEYPADHDLDNLCYAEASAFIGYIFDKYGPDKFHQFVKDSLGGSIDLAMLTNFGADSATIKNQWEVSLGLPAKTHAPAATLVPATVVPFKAGTLSGVATRTTPLDVGGDPGLLLYLIGGGVALVVTLMGIGGAILWDRRRAQIKLALLDEGEREVLAEKVASTDSRRDRRGVLSARVTMAAVVPVAIALGMIYSLIDPKQSWQSSYYATVAIAGVGLLVVAVVAIRDLRARRLVLAPIVTIVALIALMAGTVLEGRASGTDQGEAYENASAFALAYQSLSAAGAPRTDLIRIQTEWAKAAYDVNDYAQATSHYQAAIALSRNSTEWHDDEEELENITVDWSGNLVKAHQYDQAVRANAQVLTSRGCSKPCQTVFQGALGRAYLAWATDLLTAGHPSDAEAKLQALQKALPGTTFAATAKRVTDNKDGGLTAALAAGKDGDTNAMNLLLAITIANSPTDVVAAEAAAVDQSVTASLSTSMHYKPDTHVFFLGFSTSKDAQTYLDIIDSRTTYVDMSVLKVATVTDNQGNITVRLPAGYYYMIAWEAPAEGGNDYYFRYSTSIYHVQPFTPLNIGVIA